MNSPLEQFRNGQQDRNGPIIIIVHIIFLSFLERGITCDAFQALRTLLCHRGALIIAIRGFKMIVGTIFSVVEYYQGLQLSLSYAL